MEKILIDLWIAITCASFTFLTIRSYQLACEDMHEPNLGVKIGLCILFLVITLYLLRAFIKS